MAQSTDEKAAHKQRKEASKLTKEEWREFTKTVWSIANTSDPNHPAVFPPEIPRRLIKLFSFVDDVVLDPFAGTGTTAHVALELDRKAVAVDQNKEFTKLIRKGHRAEIDSGDLIARTGDCRNMAFLPDESAGLVVTSPPYWNKAEYGGNGSNIGNLSGYSEFLRAMAPAMEECFRVLQPGRKLALVTANVNQFTDHGLLTFPLAADLLTVLRDVGFLVVSEVVWNKDGTGGKWGSANHQRPIFGSYPYPPNFLFKNVHEYILIVAKPAVGRNKSANALPYETLMA